MPQSIRSIVLELQPECTTLLRSLIENLKATQHTTEKAYAVLGAALPELHFMSVTIFPDAQYDPVLVLEVNFDGPPGPFWTRFEAAFGEALRAMLRCGKTPRDGRGTLFGRVTGEESVAPMAPLLEALAVAPAVGHQGNRGLDRSRIEAEAALFATAQALIDAGAIPQGTTAQQTHARLRTALLSDFPWLGTAQPPRIARRENAADWARALGFAALLLLLAMLPGLLVSLVLPPLPALVLLLGVGSWFLSRLGLQAAPGLPPPGVVIKIGASLLAIGALVAILYTVADAVSGAFHSGRPEPLAARFGTAVLHSALGIAGLFPVIAGLLAWVRRLECRDPPQDAPVPDEVTLRAMAQREDKIAQNHMGSLVHLKPGILRAILVRAALHALGLYLRLSARDGYLGSMRTIHFAHWAIIGNGSRLMFFSNFDGSWESYLDDFIEKAAMGLTLAWTGGIGFPPTRFLVLDGALQGRKFKAWARHSMAESLFWFSGYTAFTVNQIERQARVAERLRKPSLEPTEAAAWALDL